MLFARLRRLEGFRLTPNRSAMPLRVSPGCAAAMARAFRSVEATSLSLRHIAGLGSRDELRGLFNPSGRLGVRAAPRHSRHALLELRAPA